MLRLPAGPDFAAACGQGRLAAEYQETENPTWLSFIPPDVCDTARLTSQAVINIKVGDLAPVR